MKNPCGENINMRAVGNLVRVALAVYRRGVWTPIGAGVIVLVSMKSKA
jgi:hypothetical protein